MFVVVLRVVFDVLVEFLFGFMLLVGFGVELMRLFFEMVKVLVVFVRLDGINNVLDDIKLICVVLYVIEFWFFVGEVSVWLLFVVVNSFWFKYLKYII